MSPALSTRETGMAWIQHQYTIRLIAAEHYQCQLCEIYEHLRQASIFQAM